MLFALLGLLLWVLWWFCTGGFCRRPHCLFDGIHVHGSLGRPIQIFDVDSWQIVWDRHHGARLHRRQIEQKQRTTQAPHDGRTNDDVWVQQIDHLHRPQWQTDCVEGGNGGRRVGTFCAGLALHPCVAAYDGE